MRRLDARRENVVESRHSEENPLGSTAEQVVIETKIYNMRTDRSKKRRRDGRVEGGRWTDASITGHQPRLRVNASCEWHIVAVFVQRKGSSAWALFEPTDFLCACAAPVDKGLDYKLAS